MLQNVHPGVQSTARISHKHDLSAKQNKHGSKRYNNGFSRGLPDGLNNDRIPTNNDAIRLHPRLLHKTKINVHPKIQNKARQ